MEVVRSKYGMALLNRTTPSLALPLQRGEGTSTIRARDPSRDCPGTSLRSNEAVAKILYTHDFDEKWRHT